MSVKFRIPAALVVTVLAGAGLYACGDKRPEPDAPPRVGDAGRDGPPRDARIDAPVDAPPDTPLG